MGGGYYCLRVGLAELPQPVWLQEFTSLATIGYSFSSDSLLVQLQYMYIYFH